MAAMSNAELALAKARADSFAKLQATTNKLSAEAIQVLVQQTLRGGRAGGPGGRGGFGGGPSGPPPIPGGFEWIN